MAESINSVGWAFYDWQFDADGSPNSNSEPPEPSWLRNLVGVDFFSAVVMIYGTKITDAGLEQLCNMTQLQRLDLSHTQITDAGLEHLEGLTQLQDLWLYDTNVTDAGLEHLNGLTQLQVLWLYDTDVTDAGLEYLNGLTQLQVLSLYGTKITDAGVKKLQQALPNCKIDH